MPIHINHYTGVLIIIMCTARSKETSGPYPIVLSPSSLATPSPTFTPKSGQSDQQVRFNLSTISMSYHRES